MTGYIIPRRLNVMPEEATAAFEKWYAESGLIDKGVALEAWEACYKFCEEVKNDNVGS